MRLLRRLLTLALIYVGIVIAFESLIGYVQPAGDGTLVLTTFDDDGNPHDRVLAAVESQGDLYLSANHWPRAWYDQALRSREVEVTRNGTRGRYEAIPVAGAEHERLMAEHPHGLAFRIVTGFPPRSFLRLEPR